MPKFLVTNHFKATLASVVEADNIDEAYRLADEICENADISQYAITNKLEGQITQLEQ